MDKQTASVAVVLATVVALFAVLQPFLPSYSQPFSEVGVLGPGRTIGGYPKSVAAGSEIHLYGFIGNHEGMASYYRFLVKLGDQNTQISNSTYAQAPVIFVYSRVLEDNQSTIFPLAIALSEPGTNVKLIFELWSFNATTSSFTYTGSWNQLLLNVTNH